MCAVYCYVINYAPETGQPCYRLQISVYNANHEYRRLKLKNGENCQGQEYGK
jgi:hypothetical protein